MQVKQVHATGGFKCKSCFLSLLADMTERCPCATHAYWYLRKRRRLPFDPVLLPLLTSSTCANNIDCIYHFTVHVLGQTKHIDRFYA